MCDYTKMVQQNKSLLSKMNSVLNSKITINKELESCQNENARLQHEMRRQQK